MNFSQESYTFATTSGDTRRIVERGHPAPELRRRADEPGWWQEYSDIATEAVEMPVEIGEHAATVHSYDNVYVQGLLQTRPYAETLIGNAKPFVSPTNVDRIADLHMRRQQRLGEDSFEGLVAVLTEGVIRTLVGG